MTSVLQIGSTRRETAPGYYRIEGDGFTRVYHQLAPKRPQSGPKRVFRGVFDGLHAKRFLIRPKTPSNALGGDLR